ncbi:MAG: hypothetical protein M3O34_20545 [Chloroflexota bacterium]|nr:hypothetical protein [Chloroflexota bacterium]
MSAEGGSAGRSRQGLRRGVAAADTFDQLIEIKEGSRGFIRAHWCGSAACEAAVKEKTGATIRCLPLNEPAEDGRCIVDEQPSQARVLFARAY